MAEDRSEVDRWESAKRRIRDAYARTPSSLIFEFQFKEPRAILEKSDVELLEELADYAELAANVLLPDGKPVNVEERLNDAYLRRAFAFHRHWMRKLREVEQQCRFCATREGRILPWETTLGRATRADLPWRIFVCEENRSCWEKAHSEHYALARIERTRMAARLAEGGRNVSEIANLLFVSPQTIRKDLRRGV